MALVTKVLSKFSSIAFLLFSHPFLAISGVVLPERRSTTSTSDGLLATNISENAKQSSGTCPVPLRPCL